MVRSGGLCHVLQLVERGGRAAFSGAENHVVELLRGLADRGVDTSVVFVVIGGGAQTAAATDLLRDHGVEVRTIRRTDAARQDPITVRELRRVVRELRPDVVHTHLDHASEIASVAACSAGVRTQVLSVHNDDPALRSPVGRVRLHASRLLTARFVAISGAVRDLLVREVGLPAGRVDVVHYGIEAPSHPRSRAAARAHLALPPSAFVAGFVGRLTEQKNVPAFLRMLADVPGATGVLVGEGPDEPSLRHQADALGVAAHFTGFRDDAPDLMAAFDVLCLPSRWEGLGLVVLEAMARGVPVVASDRGALPEILGHGMYGAVVPFDDDAAFAAAVSDCREPSREVRGRVRLARERVAVHHSTTAMVDRMLGVYERARASASASATTG